MSSVLISESYRAQQEKLHENPNYGVASIEYAPLVAEIVTNLGVTELLDYGAGKANRMRTSNEKRLVKHAFRYLPYDPAVERFSDAPEPAEMVACIDVLEHIEPELLDNVLNDLERLTEVVAFITVHCGPAAKVLPDGRNAHLTQQPPEWWLPKILERFDLQNYARTDAGFHCICYAKGMSNGSNN
jgi:hypothetical protein